MARPSTEPALLRPGDPAPPGQRRDHVLPGGDERRHQRGQQPGERPRARRWRPAPTGRPGSRRPACARSRSSTYGRDANAATDPGDDAGHRTGQRRARRRRRARCAGCAPACRRWPRPGPAGAAAGGRRPRTPARPAARSPAAPRPTDEHRHAQLLGAADDVLERHLLGRRRVFEHRAGRHDHARSGSARNTSDHVIGAAVATSQLRSLTSAEASSVRRNSTTSRSWAGNSTRPTTVYVRSPSAVVTVPPTRGAEAGHRLLRQRHLGRGGRGAPVEHGHVPGASGRSRRPRPRWARRSRPPCAGGRPRCSGIARVPGRQRGTARSAVGFGCPSTRPPAGPGATRPVVRVGQLQHGRPEGPRIAGRGGAHRPVGRLGPGQGEHVVADGGEG